MSVIYAGGKLGAACYHLDTSEVRNLKGHTI